MIYNLRELRIKFDKILKETYGEKAWKKLEKIDTVIGTRTYKPPTIVPTGTIDELNITISDNTAYANYKHKPKNAEIGLSHSYSFKRLRNRWKMIYEENNNSELYKIIIQNEIKICELMIERLDKSSESIEGFRNFVSESILRIYLDDPCSIN